MIQPLNTKSREKLLLVAAGAGVGFVTALFTKECWMFWRPIYLARNESDAPAEDAAERLIENGEPNVFIL